jgi:TolB-like protein/tetratricopeptide (TPR) repeat protein
VSVFRELRRRKVFRFGGIYVMGAWLVFQVADVFFPAWGVPDAAVRYLVYAAVACFPIALVFSWFYDISASGITRTLPTGAAETRDLGLKRTDYMVLAGLFVVACAILYNSLGRVVESAGEAAPVAQQAREKPPNSIAVLPFENLDPDPDTGYFSNGVSEEILHRLGASRMLKVIGRASSFPFGGADIGLDQISDILGVHYLLSGSIRRVGDRVRLTARLLDDAGYQVWSESYDGELRDIFAFQDRIAEEVAGEITREVVVLESLKPARIAKNSEAYGQYLIGREYFHDRPALWQNKAAAAYRKAIEADPEYAPPYAGLAIAVKMGATIEDQEDRWPYINGLIDQALELDPNLAEGWLAKGLPNAGEPGFDPERNVEYLHKALKLEPDRGIAYNWLAIAMRWAGRDDWVRVRERGLEYDPLNPPLVLNNSDVYLARSDFEGWKRSVSKLLDLPEPPGMVFEALAMTHYDWGRLSEALVWLKRAVRAHEGRVAWHLEGISHTYEQLGMPAAADDWADLLEQYFGESNDRGKRLKLELKRLRNQLDNSAITPAWLQQYFALNPDFAVEDIAATVLISAGRYRDGIELLEGLVRMPESWDREVFLGEENFENVHWLAYAYQRAGMEEQAESTLTWASRWREFWDSIEAFHDNPHALINNALHFASVGDLPRAASALRKAVDAGWREYRLEKNNPVWRGVWNTEEFAPIVADILGDLERQRLEVEATEAERDFRAEFEALVAESRN